VSENDELRQKIADYEEIFHSLHVARCITMDSEKIVAILSGIDAWAFAHNCSNGTQSDEECRMNIAKKLALLKLI